jgi:hypothetical protein
LSEEEEKIKKIGIEDGYKEIPEDENYASEEKQPNKNYRNAYNLGYQIGKAKKQGERDGANRVREARRDIGADNDEVRIAYLNAYQIAKGPYILKGFEDGVVGRPRSLLESGSSFNFSPEFSKLIKLGSVNPETESDYDYGYIQGNEEFRKHIPNLLKNAEADGTLDGNEGKPKYNRKFTIKVKPLLGRDVDRSIQKDKEYKIDYGKLDLEAVYSDLVVPGFPPPIGVQPGKYGAYAEILYNKGYEEAIKRKGTHRSKTYRRKNKSKTRTYKKKLSKK